MNDGLTKLAELLADSPNMSAEFYKLILKAAQEYGAERHAAGYQRANGNAWGVLSGMQSEARTETGRRALEMAKRKIEAQRQTKTEATRAGDIVGGLLGSDAGR